MAPSSDPGADRQLTLLKIACSVAWADGEVSPEERSLLLKLVARYFPAEPGQESLESAAEQLTAWAQDSALLDGLIARLESEEDRLLALKLGYLMARVGQRPGDSSPINSQEKAAYRRLVEGLGLGEAQIQEVEWASEQELTARKGPWGVLGSLFGDLGNWPTREMLESPGVQWL
ncbi:TerB family tellurite resistance protein [Vulcanococcus limneticus Candia 3F8]|uniref:tellurite resistance TerB family protein n=1 Tax=Vulcanococcus limneticus TaxID=2170428 RepID=UPI000B99BB36|nr:TerB family tellurite resistance protein [Vulcanococcus limneticus]MCP9792560.1 TerB family tellurite resistance protein [Vulcanococcus limneticus MW73D5]MCP9894191.1 TerB family tellurite resistance protein [Vulcanococcus limneticus Candia 3F8]MCP9897952.1 TerB family tellurite resistance protein [Vulcanococcus limneticus Candia 3B3]